MNKKIKIIISIALISGTIAGLVWFFSTVDVAVLNPKGEIAEKQRDLIVFTTLLSAIVVIPVFTLLAFFSWKYRESNKKARYRPEWDNNKVLESIWWGIPCVIILILAVVTWRSSHELDPYRAIDSNTKPISVQVVALQWKWLFIYPEQQVASVNFVQFPENTPINLTITADSPMNSFWIPSLGGQVYAMSGMSTKLHLISSEKGDYKGSSANISGKGFADMTFTAQVTTREGFDAWVGEAQRSSSRLNETSYAELAEPGVLKVPTVFDLETSALYDTIVKKYMVPVSDSPKEDHAPSMHDHSMMDMTEEVR